MPFVKGVKIPEEDSLIRRGAEIYGEHETVSTLTDIDYAFDEIARVLSDSLDIDYILRLIHRECTTPQQM